MIKMQTEQATTGVVAVVRSWSGSAIAASRFGKTPNHGTDLSTPNTPTPLLGTFAWSPPV